MQVVGEVDEEGVSVVGSTDIFSGLSCSKVLGLVSVWDKREIGGDVSGRRQQEREGGKREQGAWGARSSYSV